VILLRREEFLEEKRRIFGRKGKNFWKKREDKEKIKRR